MITHYVVRWDATSVGFIMSAIPRVAEFGGPERYGARAEPRVKPRAGPKVKPRAEPRVKPRVRHRVRSAVGHRGRVGDKGGRGAAE